MPETTVYVETIRFGRIEVSPETIITFPHGLAGLPQLQRFKLLHEENREAVVHWLQSLDDGAVSFNLVDPGRLGIRYELLLNDAECELLEAQSAGDVIVLLMVGVRDESGQLEASAGLPFILNPLARRGLQMANVRPEIVFRSI